MTLDTTELVIIREAVKLLATKPQRAAKARRIAELLAKLEAALKR